MLNSANLMMTIRDSSRNVIERQDNNHVQYLSHLHTITLITDLSHSEFSFFLFYFLSFDSALIVNLHIKVPLITNISVLYSLLIICFQSLVLFNRCQECIPFCYFSFLFLFRNPFWENKCNDWDLKGFLNDCSLSSHRSLEICFEEQITFKAKFGGCNSL